MEMVTLLVVGSTAYILFGTLLESIFFNLYNSSFHPFAKILDISDTSQGRLFQQYILINNYQKEITLIF